MHFSKKKAFFLILLFISTSFNSALLKAEIQSNPDLTGLSEASSSETSGLLTGLPEIDSNRYSRNSIYIGITTNYASVSYLNNNGIDYNNILSDKFKANSFVNGFVVGSRFSNHFSHEISYSRTGSDKTITSPIYGIQKSSSNLSLIKYDLIYDINILQDKFSDRMKMLFIGGLVAAGQNTTYTGTQTQVGIKQDSFGIGAELGAGLSFNITKNMVLRGDIRYVKINMSDVADKIINVSAGLYFYI